MASATDNPYPSLKTATEETPANNKNTFLRGFFTGWCIMIVNLALSSLLFWSLRGMIQEIFHLGRHEIEWIFAIMPISVLGTTIWLTAKRHYQSALGITIALVSMAAFSALFVTVIFAFLQ
jgi:hypothetical protein